MPEYFELLEKLGVEGLLVGEPDVRIHETLERVPRDPGIECRRRCDGPALG